MADLDDAKDLLAASEGSDHDLVKKLRGALRERIDKVESGPSEREAELEAELAGYRRSALFDQAGIGSDEPTEKLFREAMSGREDLTLETIQAEAAKYGLGSTPQATNPTTPEVQAEHEAMSRIAGEAPAPPPDIAERLAAANDMDTLRALEAEAGLVVENEEFLDIF